MDSARGEARGGDPGRGPGHARRRSPRAASDESVRLTVLVLAAEADVRRYVRECLRECADVRMVEAVSVAMALTLEATDGAAPARRRRAAE